MISTPMCAMGEPSGPIENGIDVHGAAAHAAPEQSGERVAHLDGVLPVVGRTGVGLVLATDESPVLDPCHVGGIGPRPVAVGPLGVREPGEGSGGDELRRRAGRTPRMIRRTTRPGRAESGLPSPPPSRGACGERSAAVMA